MGPFVATFDADSDNRYRNYAIPDDGATPSPSDIAALIAAFEKRDRYPRLEYVPALAPSVLMALTDAGFNAERELPLMYATKATLESRPNTAAVEIVLATTTHELERAASVQNEAYGEGEHTVADVQRLGSMIDRGGCVALARHAVSGEAVGSGLFAAPIDGVTEIAAVGVRSGHRRQGIGSAITARLADEALSRGIDLPFLMAAHEEEERIYERIGFESFATMLHIAT